MPAVFLCRGGKCHAILTLQSDIINGSTDVERKRFEKTSYSDNRNAYGTGSYRVQSRLFGAADYHDADASAVFDGVPHADRGTEPDRDPGAYADSDGNTEPDPDAESDAGHLGCDGRRRERQSRIR